VVSVCHVQLPGLHAPALYTEFRPDLDGRALYRRLSQQKGDGPGRVSFNRTARLAMRAPGVLARPGSGLAGTGAARDRFFHVSSALLEAPPHSGRSGELSIPIGRKEVRTA